MLSVIGWIVIVAATLVTLPAFAMILCAKGMLIVLIGVGPLFIAALMFPLTKSWFDNWLGQVLTQIFTIGILAMISSVAVERIVQLGAGAGYLAASDIPLSSLCNHAGKMIIVGMIMIWVLMRSSQLAAALAGGVANSAISIGGMAAAAAGVAGVAAAAGGMAKRAGGAMNRLDKGETRASLKAKRDNASINGRKSQQAGRAIKSGATYAYRAGMAKMRTRNTIKRA
ncbi:hypothetical protein AGMMS50289_17190 [Betaproteobacteria bacterium]|nr:hypothetical protein AGMMS50289_17190 [Betaproteobacteria bacterium]